MAGDDHAIPCLASLGAFSTFTHVLTCGLRMVVTLRAFSTLAHVLTCGLRMVVTLAAFSTLAHVLTCGLRMVVALCDWRAGWRAAQPPSRAWRRTDAAAIRLLRDA